MPQFLDRRRPAPMPARIAVLARPGKGALPARRWSGSAASVPTCARPRPRRSTPGRERTAAPSCASTIPATASPAGAFEDGTISRWLEDTLAVLGAFERGAGRSSSARRWAAGLRSSPRASSCAGDPARAPAGLVLIAPATDFTERLMWDQFPEDIRAHDRRRRAFISRPSLYSDEPYPITRALIEDGRRHLLFGAPIATGCPVHILQGMQDPDVPWAPRARARRAPAGRQRLADADQGRRPPPVAARGHRAADRGGRGAWCRSARAGARSRSCFNGRSPSCRSCAQALATAASRESVRRIGAPLADRSAKSSSPG